MGRALAAVAGAAISRQALRASRYEPDHRPTHFFRSGIGGGDSACRLSGHPILIVNTPRSVASRRNMAACRNCGPSSTTAA